MMAKEPKLPRGLPGKKVVNALQKAGFFKRRQKGSHIIMQRRNPFAQVTVPAHKSIDTGTLANILRGADLSVKDFLDLL